jgi:hypothetical protein
MAQMERRTLTQGWCIRPIEPGAELPSGRQYGSVLERAEDWLAVPAMPAMVHDVLRHHGRIETPWLPGRAEACRWVAERDWLYAVEFAVADPAAEAWLCFKGLDTIVDVYLNGVKIASHSNMYLPLRVDISGRLRANNALRLHFRTVFDLTQHPPVPVAETGGDEPCRVRRSCHNYGSYLGPNPLFSRVGVFGEVELEILQGGHLKEVVADASVSEDLKRGTVCLDVAGQTSITACRLSARLVGPDGSEAAGAEAGVQPGPFHTRLTLALGRPGLWWPRGMGKQPLYRVIVELLDGAGAVLHQEQRAIGFRRIAMPQPLRFVVNGKPARLWGGNWVVPRWDTAVWDHDRAARLLDLAENAHYNALRVWGETEAPHDYFYDMTDSRGFLVWQDFTDLPLRDDPRSRKICRLEAAHLIRRLKHHPSLLLWCGGNEQAMWNDLAFGGPGGEWAGRRAAEDDVGEVCRALDPDRVYLPNSPYHGRDNNDPEQWDTHGYTNLWYVPGSDYLNFASEDTRISAPPLRSLRRFLAPEDLWPERLASLYRQEEDDPWPRSWSKYTTSDGERKTGPVEQFPAATGPEEAVYRLGMAAAAYYRDTIERQRRGRLAGAPPERRVCGGYLVWKHNDSWPQIYSGKVDYFLEPTIAYYAIRRAFAPVLLSWDIGNYIRVWLVNDAPDPVAGEVRIQLIRLRDGGIAREAARPVRAEPDRSVVVARLDEIGIGTFRRDHVLFATLRDRTGSVVARANAFLEIERRLAFPDAALTLTWRPGGIEVSTDKVALAVTIEGDAGGDGFGWAFEDNYFDLMPGERKTVRVLGAHNSGRITARAWYSSHPTVLNWHGGSDATGTAQDQGSRPEKGRA